MDSLRLKKVSLRDFSAEELRASAAATGEHSGCFPITICCPYTTPVGDAYLHNRPAAEQTAGQVQD